MRKIYLSFIITLILVFNIISETNAIYYDSEILMSYEDLHGSIGPICDGNNIICVCGNNSYLFLDKNDNWRIIANHDINHRKIRKKDGAHVNQVIYENNTFYFLVLDHSVCKSYIIEHPINGKPKYTKLIAKQLIAFTILPDGYFVAEYDDNQTAWYAKLDMNGQIKWKYNSKEKGFIPLSCSLIDDEIRVCSGTSDRVAFQIITFSENGNISFEKTLDISSEITNNQRVFPQYFGKISKDSGDVFSGEVHIGNSIKGFVVQLNKTGDKHSVNVYDKYSRIQDVVDISGKLFCLGFTQRSDKKPNCVFSMDGLTNIVLESQDSQYTTFRLFTNNKTEVFGYGHKISKDDITKPSYFIRKILK